MGKKERSLLLILGLGGLIISISANSHFVSLNPPIETVTPQKSLYQTARQITVKIFSQEDIIGSGTIIKQQHHIYLIITNAHVLDAGNAPYFVQTNDGQLHPATPLNTHFGHDDLALLKIESKTKNYTVAKLGASDHLTTGEKVYAAGFPFFDSSKASPSPTITFAFKTGEITQILDKALEGGYQIGFTTEVTKGMSGGALINHRGEVIAINGRHAYPLWNAPDYYEDGSQVSSPIQKVVSETSWAIPIERIIIEQIYLIDE